MNKIEIHQFIRKHFNLEELKTLCLYLSIQFDDLGGDGVPGKARELIEYCERAGRLQQLEETLTLNFAEASNYQELDKNISLAIAIINSASVNLVEHQKILNQLFSRSPDLEKITDEFREIFMMQNERGKFGEWRASISSAIVLEENEQKKDCLQQLSNLLDKLHFTYYSLEYVSEGNDRLPQSKGLIYSVLEQNDDIDLLRSTAMAFLEDQRRIVEQLGEIVGNLKSISDD